MLILLVFFVFSGLKNADAVLQDWVPTEYDGKGELYALGMD